MILSAFFDLIDRSTRPRVRNNEFEVVDEPPCFTAPEPYIAIPPKHFNCLEIKTQMDIIRDNIIADSNIRSSGTIGSAKWWFQYGHHTSLDAYRVLYNAKKCGTSTGGF